MTGAAWFLVWVAASGQSYAVGPFMFEHTCQQAIETAREERTRDDGGSADWYLPDNARCEIRPRDTKARWRAPYGVEGGRW